MRTDEREEQQPGQVATDRLLEANRGCCPLARGGGAVQEE